MKSFRQELQLALDERQKNALFRRRRTLYSPQGTEVILDGQHVTSFCSNDYLGLADHPDVVEAFHQGLNKFGAGSGASHLVSGHLVPHELLEQELAAFTGRSAALVFSSGYMANVGVLTTLLDNNDVVLEDRLNHASLLDGGLFSGARFKRFAHLDTAALEKKLSSIHDARRKLVVADGVFSMDGEIAALPELIRVTSNHNGLIMIDDAHGIGVLGKNGGGTIAHWQEQGAKIDEDNLQILIGTFGKAFGASGAFVAGSEELIETLIQFCRPYIYTTAISPAQAEAVRASLKIIQKDNWRRQYLAQLIKRFRAHCEDLGLTMIPSSTPIQAVVIGDVSKTIQASEQLMHEGVFVSAIRPPTVPAGTARLRVTFSALHTESQFQKLLDVFEKYAHCWVEDASE